MESTAEGGEKAINPLISPSVHAAHLINRSAVIIYSYIIIEHHEYCIVVLCNNNRRRNCTVKVVMYLFRGQNVHLGVVRSCVLKIFKTDAIRCSQMYNKLLKMR